MTLPKAVRDRLGLRPGTAIEFTAVEGTLVGRKVEAETDPVQAVTGIIQGEFDVDEYLSGVRGPAV